MNKQRQLWRSSQKANKTSKGCPKTTSTHRPVVLAKTFNIFDKKVIFAGRMNSNIHQGKTKSFLTKIAKKKKKKNCEKPSKSMCLHGLGDAFSLLV